MEFAVNNGMLYTSPVTLTPGDRFQCVLLNEYHPDRFFIKIVDPDLQEEEAHMNRELEKYYRPILNRDNVTPVQQRIIDLLDIVQNAVKTGWEKLVDDLKVHFGDYVVIYWPEKDSFFRGAIAEWSTDLHTVYLIDEGIFLRARHTAIMPLSSEFHKYPHFTLTCYLSELNPAQRDGPAIDDRRWNDEALEYFRSVAKPDQMYEIVIKPRDAWQATGRVSVKLISDDRGDIGELMVASNHAIPAMDSLCAGFNQI